MAKIFEQHEMWDRRRKQFSGLLEIGFSSQDTHSNVAVLHCEIRS